MNAKRGRGSIAAQHQRQQQIQDFISNSGSRTIEEVAAQVGVSTVTIYRDIADLESLGLLRLNRGLVSAAASNRHESTSEYRLRQAVSEKESLALAALELIEPGSTILMDDSTTGIFLARLLVEKSPLTVVTNYLFVAQEVSRQRDNRLLITGGEYLVWAQAMFGPTTVSTLRNMRVDICLMSASAIVNGTAYHPIEAAAEVKRTMMSIASRNILYVDHSKFERSAMHKVSSLDNYDVVIVDAQTPQSTVADLKSRGIKIIQARKRRNLSRA